MSDTRYTFESVCGYCGYYSVRHDLNKNSPGTTMDDMIEHHHSEHENEGHLASFKISVNQEPVKKSKLVLSCKECDMQFYLNLDAKTLENHFEVEHPGSPWPQYSFKARLVLE